ncbi:phage tail tape measure protein [Dethiosulfovibrio sp. F2B]|uniref:phage tail tape measure protein n=1 Tax=Dethiosulfovibrio faecalis TaxID=2720018 RepID=UPI001F359CB7|nr:phage tail tape measure protein [Dethiosulfovibrio faecalis]MCF4151751.1 phage tail tape measure protein [Dethiosulfovibrio faecalis]
MPGGGEIWIKIGAEVSGAVKSLDGLADSVGSMGKKISGMGKSMGTVFDPLMKGLTAGVAAVSSTVAGLTAASLSIGGDFEEAMLKVQGVSGATAEELQSMTDVARQLGADLPVSASDAASAMYSLSSAGFNAGQVMDSVQSVVSLSIAQNYDLGESANAVVMALKSYSLEASESERVTDVFNNSISSSMMTMEKFQSALRYVGPVASKLGLSLETTAAAMSTLADAGLDGSQIGTSLRSVMLKLIDPTDEAAKVLSRLGVKAYDTATGKLRPLDEIFRQLKDSGMDAADAARIFGTEGATAGLTLAGMADKLKDLEAQMGKTGTTQELLAKQMESWNNKLKEVQSALSETMMITFDGMKENAKGVIGTVKEIIDSFNTWAKETGVLGDSVKAFFDGLGSGMGSVDEFKDKLNSLDVEEISKGFENFGEGVSKLVGALKDLGDMIPWGWLINNFKGLALAITGLWATGKIITVCGNIALLGEKLIWLLNAAIIPLMTTPLGGLFAALGVTVGVLTKKLYDFSKAQDEAWDAKESADQMEENARNYTEAVKGNAEALAKLPPYYREMADASIKAKEEAKKSAEETQRNIDKMKEQAEAGTFSIENVMAVYGDKIKQLAQEAGKAGQDIKSYVLQGLGDMPESTRKVVAQAVDLMGEELGRGNDALQKGFSPLGVDELGAALEKVRAMSKEVQAKGKKAMEVFGLSSSEAGAVMKEELLKTVIGIKDQFEESSPYMATAFVSAMEKMGMSGGDALIKAVSSKLRGGIGTPLEEMTDGEALKQALKNLDKNILVARQQAEEAISSFGTPRDNAMETFREQVIKEASHLESELKNKNPHLADAFVRALTDAGKRGGGKLFEEISKALKAAKDAGEAELSGIAKTSQEESWIDGKKTLFQGGDFAQIDKEVQRIKALVSAGYRQMNEENEKEIVTSWTQNGKAVTEVFDKTFATIRRQSVDLFDSISSKKADGAASPASPVGIGFDGGEPMKNLKSVGATLSTEATVVVREIQGVLSRGLSSMEIPLSGITKSLSVSAGVMGETIVRGINQILQKSAPALEASGTILGTAMGNAMAKGIDRSLSASFARLEKKIAGMQSSIKNSSSQAATSGTTGTLAQELAEKGGGL